MKKKIRNRVKRSDTEIFDYLNDKIAKCDEYLAKDPDNVEYKNLKTNLQQMFTVLNIPLLGAKAKKIISEAMDKDGWHSEEIKESEGD